MRATAIFTFLFRLYHYEDHRLDEAEQVLQEDMGCGLQGLHLMFYEDFQAGFCRGAKENCTINLHTFMHLLESRRRTGMLWETSTEPVEAVYSVMRRSYRVGTSNIPKQIMEKFYLRDL